MLTQTPIHKRAGFSLIELLVVILIVGIMMSIAVLAFGDFGNTRKVQLFQQHLANVIQFARTKAILEATTFGLDISPSHQQCTFYQFSFKKDSAAGEWQMLGKDKLFFPQRFPENKKILFSHPLKPSHPEIIISSDGHISPFSLAVTTLSNVVVTLKIAHNGQATIQENPHGKP